MQKGRKDRTRSRVNGAVRFARRLADALFPENTPTVVALPSRSDSTQNWRRLIESNRIESTGSAMPVAVGGSCAVADRACMSPRARGVVGTSAVAVTGRLTGELFPGRNPCMSRRCRAYPHPSRSKHTHTHTMATHHHRFDTSSPWIGGSFEATAL